VNVCYSGALMKLVSGMFVMRLSQTMYRSFGKFSRKLPSLRAISCCTLILPILLLMISGCGRHKEELENARQQIEKLNAEVGRLTEEITKLNREKSRLSDDANTLSDKNAQIQKELDSQSKAKGVLSAENRDLNKKYSSVEQELTALKHEKERLTKEFEECRKKAAEMVPATKPPAGIEPQSMKQQEVLSPCDQVLAFMKASEGIVRQHKDPERTQLLERTRQEYAQKMKGAPEKAIKAAEDWVKEGGKFWDNLADDSTFRLLQLRNTVLESCGKSPGGAGFK
jgi:DNA repair exonuclease SbcCD ATPase subunit